jgi:hypothetical protein
MAENEKKAPTPSTAEIADVGVPNPDAMRELAEDLPENDAVQKAYKDGMLADSAQQEAKAKAKDRRRVAQRRPRRRPVPR